MERLTQILNEQRILSKEVVQLKQFLANQQSRGLIDQVVKVGDIQVLAVEMAGGDRETLRQTMDQLKQQLGRSAD